MDEAWGEYIAMRVIEWIAPETYKEIKKVMPILCVDLLVHDDNRFLLLLRKNEPAKGLWWTPGGRVFKGETIKDAAHRKAREELGMEVVIERLIGVYDQMWETSPDGVPIHCPDVYYLAKLVGKPHEIKMDGQHLAFMWFGGDSWSLGLHTYIQQVVIDSGAIIDSGTAPYRYVEDGWKMVR